MEYKKVIQLTSRSNSVKSILIINLYSVDVTIANIPEHHRGVIADTDYCYNAEYTQHTGNCISPYHPYCFTVKACEVDEHSNAGPQQHHETQ